MGKILSIAYKKSAIGYPQNQKKVVKALGFRCLNDIVEHDDTPQIRGMVHKIRHLLEVTEIDKVGEA